MAANKARAAAPHSKLPPTLYLEPGGGGGSANNATHTHGGAQVTIHDVGLMGVPTKHSNTQTLKHSNTQTLTRQRVER